MGTYFDRDEISDDKAGEWPKNFPNYHFFSVFLCHIWRLCSSHCDGNFSSWLISFDACFFQAQGNFIVTLAIAIVGTIVIDDLEANLMVIFDHKVE